MRRSWLAAVVAALAVVLIFPATACGRADVVGMSCLECSVGLGLRLSISIQGASIRGALVLPSPEMRIGAGDARGGAELLGLNVGALDLVRWGVPIVRAVADVTVNGLGRREVGEARI